MSERPLALTLNGRPLRAEAVPDAERLLDTLRWRLGLRGTKEGCRTGDCGACTVLVDGRGTLSCLTLAHEIDGAAVVTIEGIDDDSTGTVVREAFRDAGALQCGYCTPGFVMALTGLLKERGSAVPADALLDDLGGNLCRCTGYVAIARAAELARRRLG
ncbi:MAG TPA: (2Fe-2S)-binding protein [Thermoplasmata archaeon]|nr:(2Fe-2S)-binding protein [Thermoplasmata archaeon]